MARCPNSGVQWCRDGVTSKCPSCPAYSWQVRIVLTLRRLRPLLAALIAIIMAMHPQPARAAHNAGHDCPTMIAQAIAQGLMGGVFGQRSDGMVTWTDGLYFCVFEGDEAKTLFRASAGAAYWARDLARNAGRVISQVEAQTVIGTPRGTGGGIAPLIVPRLIVDPGCWQYDRRGRVTNVCVNPYPSVNQ